MRDFDIDSDLKQEKFQNIKLVQGDRGNKIKINVYEDGQPVNLAGCSVTAKYKRADGEIINDGVIENIHDNSFDAVMDSSITKVAGTLKMLFTIEKDDVKVSTFLLLADVRESIGENTGSSGGNTGGGSGEVTIDLSNYYKKIETYSKNQIDARFKDIANNFKLVSGDNNTIKLMFGTKELSSVAINGGTVEPTPTTYSITNTLSNATNSNTATFVEENSSYSANISANSGYKLKTVTVTMGGTDITNTAYSSGIITISSVTGNIIITVITEVDTDVVVGNIDDNNNISLTGLSTGTYTLKYEDNSGILSNYDTIATVEVV